jgi:hypothetical protein
MMSSNGETNKEKFGTLNIGVFFLTCHAHFWQGFSEKALLQFTMLAGWFVCHKTQIAYTFE